MFFEGKNGRKNSGAGPTRWWAGSRKNISFSPDFFGVDFLNRCHCRLGTPISRLALSVLALSVSAPSAFRFAFPEIPEEPIGRSAFPAKTPPSGLGGATRLASVGGKENNEDTANRRMSNNRTIEARSTDRFFRLRTSAFAVRLLECSSVRFSERRQTQPRAAVPHFNLPHLYFRRFTASMIGGWFQLTRRDWR